MTLHPDGTLTGTPEEFARYRVLTSATTDTPDLTAPSTTPAPNEGVTTITEAPAMAFQRARWMVA